MKDVGKGQFVFFIGFLYIFLTVAICASVQAASAPVAKSVSLLVKGGEA
jgi:uncharacterized membrane protein